MPTKGSTEIRRNPWPERHYYGIPAVGGRPPPRNAGDAAEGENRVHRLRYREKRDGERRDIYTRWLGALSPGS